MNRENGFMNQMMDTGYVRILHAVPDAPNVDVYANDTLLVQNLAYGKNTGYMMVPAGTYQVTIYATGTKANPVLSKMLTVGRNDVVTAAAAGMLQSIELLAIPDADIQSVSNKALVRFIHLSPNAPAVDITLPDGMILFSNVAFKHMTDYIPVNQMTYTLQVRVAGTDQVVLTVPGVSVRNNNYYSVYAIGLVGKNPALQALLLEDGDVR